MKHAQLVTRAADWLRLRYGCGIVLSEQYCVTGEVPDVIAWRKPHVNRCWWDCKVSRADFLADANKAFRLKPEKTDWEASASTWRPQAMIAAAELPKYWGLLECKGREVKLVVKPGKVDLRTQLD